MAITEGGFCEVEAPLPTGAVPGLQEGPLLPGTSPNTLHNPVYPCFPLSPGVACGPLLIPLLQTLIHTRSRLLFSSISDTELTPVTSPARAS